MKFRLFNKWFAKFFGYFWLPCPLCGEMFGGHEWQFDNIYNSACINTDRVGIRQGICPDCTEKGLGDSPQFLRAEYLPSSTKKGGKE